MWDYDLELSDEDLDEYNHRNRRFAMGTLTEVGPDFDCLIQLDDANWTFGLQTAGRGDKGLLITTCTFRADRAIAAPGHP